MERRSNVRLIRISRPSVDILPHPHSMKTSQASYPIARSRLSLKRKRAAPNLVTQPPVHKSIIDGPLEPSRE